jgi:hypothetical protein
VRGKPVAKTPPLDATCWFYVRTPVPGKTTFRYEMVHQYTYGTDSWNTVHVPAAGDLVSFRDDGHTGVYRVLARDWMYPAYPSGSWPYSEKYPDHGPIVQIIVEQAEGLFIDQEPEEDEDG